MSTRRTKSELLMRIHDLEAELDRLLASHRDFTSGLPCDRAWAKAIEIRASITRNCLHPASGPGYTDEIAALRARAERAEAERDALREVMRRETLYTQDVGGTLRRWHPPAPPRPFAKPALAREGGE